MLAVEAGLVLGQEIPALEVLAAVARGCQMVDREQRLAERQTLAAAAAALETGKQQALEVQALW